MSVTVTVTVIMSESVDCYDFLSTGPGSLRPRTIICKISIRTIHLRLGSFHSLTTRANACNNLICGPQSHFTLFTTTERRQTSMNASKVVTGQPTCPPKQLILCLCAEDSSKTICANSKATRACQNSQHLFANNTECACSKVLRRRAKRPDWHHMCSACGFVDQASLP